MNGLLHLRVHMNYLVVQVRMIPDHDLRIPPHRDKDRVHPAPDRREEYLADLQPDQKRERHDDGGEVPGRVVRRPRELQVQIREQRAEIRDEDGSHGQYGPDQTVVDEGVDSAILHHRPGVPGRGDVGLAVQRDVAERVAVDEGYQPVQERDEAPQDRGRDAADDVAFLELLPLHHRERLTQHVDDRDDQATEADAAEGVRRRPHERAAGGSFGKAAGKPAPEIPGSVYTCDGGMDGVLQPLAEPVHRECDVHDQPDDRGPAAAAVGTRRIDSAAVGFVRDVDGDQRHGEPGRECDCCDTPESAHEEDVSMVSGNVHRGLEHQRAERDPRDPAYEADDGEDAKHEEDDTPAILPPRDVVDTRCECEDDVQDARHPDEELRKVAGAKEVRPGEGQRDAEDEDEQDESVGVEREVVG